MKVLLLSAYAAQSHVHWQRSLQVMLPDCQWQVLELPPRHFSWRMRGNPLYWSIAEREVLERDYDAVLATSMVDLATLRGLVPALALVPTAVYFHENQFAYPRGQRQQNLLEAQMVSLYSALAADRVLFNSDYNRQTFLDGCAALLAKLPDKVPAGVVDGLRSKSAVLPVPVSPGAGEHGSDGWPGAARELCGRPLRLLWAGRFEYDKGGDKLLAILRQLEHSGTDFELAVVGQQFRQSPPVYGQIEEEFAHRLVQFGYLPAREDYLSLLAGADIVLSTALHEFQGLAVLEAVASGCLPVVPDRLAYSEIYPAQYRYESHPDDSEPEAKSAVRLIIALQARLQCGDVAAPDVSAFSRTHLQETYRNVLHCLTAP